MLDISVLLFYNIDMKRKKKIMIVMIMLIIFIFVIGFLYNRNLQVGEVEVYTTFNPKTVTFGEEYTLKGVLINESGDNRKILKGSTKFAPTESNRTVIVDMDEMR